MTREELKQKEASGVKIEPKQIDLMTREKDLKEIVSGKKVEDYRKLSRYNINLLVDKDAEYNLEPRSDVTHVRFVSGYDERMKYVTCEIKGIFLDEFIKFVPEGMKPGNTAITIEIRRVVEHNL